MDQVINVDGVCRNIEEFLRIYEEKNNKTLVLVKYGRYLECLYTKKEWENINKVRRFRRRVNNIRKRKPVCPKK